MAGPGYFLGRGTVPSAAKGTLPPAGQFAFYVDSTDDHWKYIDSAGTVVDITDVGASTFPDITIADATPQFTMKDTDCTDSDDNFKIVIAATATGTGAEDIDVTFTAQDGGTDKNFLLFDASDAAVTLGYSGGKLGFYGTTEVAQASALTTASTTLTNAGTASDYAIQALTNSSPFGFASQAEGETVVDVCLNNQARINEIETVLSNLGLTA